MNWITLFASPQGRIGRGMFWAGFLAVIAASIAVDQIPKAGDYIGLLLLWPQLCIHVKRLHDMGRTGWLLPAPMAASFICVVTGVIVGGATILVWLGGAIKGHSADPAAVTALMVAVGLIAAAVFIEFGFLLWIGLTPGKPDANRYGPPPGALSP